MQLTRRHLQRLRQMYRSAGWPLLDVLEAELLAAGLLARRAEPGGAETLRVTDAGIAALAEATARQRAALSAHQALVQRVAAELVRAGRIAWCSLSLRVPLPARAAPGAPDPSPAPGAPADLTPDEPPAGARIALAATETVAKHGDGWDAVADDASAARPRWLVACPDVFSLRRSSVEAYLEPTVHEIKVSRADLLGDLRRPDKRAAYLQMGGACWYVLGQDARGRPIASADEVPPECGVLQCEGERLVLLRPAPRRAVPRLPFHVWMALARATPVAGDDEPAQLDLAAC